MSPPPADPEARAAALAGRLAVRPWRILYSGAACGAENMEIDCALLHSASREECPPTLRFYLWAPAAVSVGRFQSTDGISMEYVARRRWDLVRRPTGGRAVLHQTELTYSITLPPSAVAGAGVRTSYAVLTRALNAGIASLLQSGGVCHREPSPESQPGVREPVRGIDAGNGRGEGAAIPSERGTTSGGDRHGAREPSPYSAGWQAPRDDKSYGCHREPSPESQPGVREPVRGIDADNGRGEGAAIPSERGTTSGGDRHGARAAPPYLIGWRAPRDDRVGRAPRRTEPNCFALAAECDTVVAGRKLIGSAQVRLDGALLQHGSILLDAEPEAWKALFGSAGDLITLRSLLGRLPEPGEVVDAVLAGFRSAGILPPSIAGIAGEPHHAPLSLPASTRR